MAALFRLALVLLLLEAVFFVLLRLYIRSQRHERLEEIWDRRHPDMAGDSLARREFIRRSMLGFDKSLKSRLIWLVFILPTLAILTIVIIVNWQ